MEDIYYPSKISNGELYKVFSEVPISKDIEKRRWNLFGNILRMHLDSPAMKSLETAFNNVITNRRGRPKHSFLHTLKADVQKISQKNLENIEDLQMLRQIAKDKQSWTKVFTHSIDLDSV